MDPVIKTVGLSRNYVLGTETVHALREVLRDGVISSDALTTRAAREVMA